MHGFWVGVLEKVFEQTGHCIWASSCAVGRGAMVVSIAGGNVPTVPPKPLRMCAVSVESGGSPSWEAEAVSLMVW